MIRIPLQKSIVTKLTFYSILLIVLALSVAGLITIWVCRDLQKKEVIRGLEKTAGQVALGIYSRMEIATSILNTLAQAHDFGAMDQYAQALMLNRSLAQHRSIFDKLMVFDKSGQETARASNAAALARSDAADSPEPLEFSVPLRGQIYRGPIRISEHGDVPVATIGVPILGRNLEVKGALGAEVTLKQMWNVVSEMEYGRTGYVYVVDQHGRLVAFKELTEAYRLFGKDMSDIPEVKNFISGIPWDVDQRHEYIGLCGAQVIGSFAKISKANWAVVVEIPVEEAFAGLKHMIWSLVILILLITIVTVSMSPLIFRRAASDLDLLRKGAELIGRGNLSHYIDIKRDDELGILAQVFNGMTERLRELITDLEHRATERKEDARELAKLNEQLEQRVAERTAELVARNSELEAFSYSVSHDLRAPLRSIDGFSQALLEDYCERLEPEAQDFLKRIRKSSKRMGELIDALLELFKVAQIRISWHKVNLSVLVREVVDMYMKTEPERDVEVFIENHLVVNGDPRLLRIVIEDLVSNAWKFTSRKEKAKIEFGSEVINGSRVYFIRDNGVGFDMAYSSNLFKAFSRLHSQKDFEGTGIGLAVVDRVIKRLGGEAWAEGEVGKGAKFCFKL